MVIIEVPPLAAYLAQVPDFRQARGKRHPLGAVLLLACVAMLAGARSETAIAAWARHHGAEWRRRLGFTHADGPSQAALSRVFGGIDADALEQHVGAWAQQVLARARPAAGAAPVPWDGVALDGKTLRGSRKRGAAASHVVSAVSQRLGVVLGQVAVAGPGGEVAAAADLLAGLVLAGRVVTADALLTQASLAQAIVERGGDYLMEVKGNQPTLAEDVTTLFADAAATATCAETVDLHGGRVEHRRLAASPELVGYTDWPGLRQVLCLDRTVTDKRTGALRRERAYAVTSLAPARATPADLLALWREHWHIENRLHWVRDVTFDEDRSGVRGGSVPQVMAALRNTAIGLARAAGATNIADACRRYAAQPARALALVGLPARL